MHICWARLDNMHRACLIEIEVLSFHARHRFSAELAATVGKTGTHQAKVITQGAEAGFYCEQHDASTPEGILNCTLDTENLCVLSVGFDERGAAEH